MSRRRHADQAGGVTPEWLAVGALVVVLLLTLGLRFAPSIGQAFASAACHIIAAVAGGECETNDDVPDGVGSELDEPNLPDYCVTGQSGLNREANVGIKLLSLGDGFYGLIEHRSDGTVAVTTVSEDRVGVSAALDTGVLVHTGDDTWGLYGGASVGAELFTRLGDTYVLPDADQAERFLNEEFWKDAIDDIVPIPGSGTAAGWVIDGWNWLWGNDPIEPVLESTGVEVGIGSSADAEVVLGNFDPSIGVAVDASVGVSIDQDGNITGSLIVDGSLAADSGLDSIGGVGPDDHYVISYTYDPNTGSVTHMQFNTESVDDDGERTAYQLNIPLDDASLQDKAGLFLDALVSEDAEALANANEDLLPHATLTRQVWQDDESTYGGEGWFLGTGGGLTVGNSDHTLEEAEVWDANAGEWVTWEDCF